MTRLQKLDTGYVLQMTLAANIQIWKVFAILGALWLVAVVVCAVWIVLMIVKRDKNYD